MYENTSWEIEGMDCNIRRALLKKIQEKKENSFVRDKGEKDAKSL